MSIFFYFLVIRDVGGILSLNVYTTNLMALRNHYVNVSVFIKFSQKSSVFTLIIMSSP